MSAPLFRGQADARWPLRTTLERFSNRTWSIKEYFHIVQIVGPAVESLTGKPWQLPYVYSDVKENEEGPPPAYEFMIYLRHHGFPSPLLDWSRSPYVAAFFAFECRPHDNCEAVGFYSFTEWVHGSKMWNERKARVIGLGPTATTHERHYTQQCEYTICKKPEGDQIIYASHEEALEQQQHAISQNVLTRYVIPVSQRAQFLRKLESMNIHAYSLFRDETALMHTLAYREIEQRGW